MLLVHQFVYACVDMSSVYTYDMYICISIYLYICICICVYIYIYICIYIRPPADIYVASSRCSSWLNLCVSIHILEYIYLHMHMYIGISRGSIFV